MSRFDGAGDGDVIPWGLWQNTYRRALNGKRGKQALRDLRDALAALPKRELIADNLIELSWDADAPDDTDVPTIFEGVCAVGAYALHKGKDAAWLRRMNSSNSGEYDEGDCWATAEAGQAVGMTYTLAYELARRNDETYNTLEPGARWWAMYGWLSALIHNLPEPVFTESWSEHLWNTQKALA